MLQRILHFSFTVLAPSWRVYNFDRWPGNWENGRFRGINGSRLHIICKKSPHLFSSSGSNQSAVYASSHSTAETWPQNILKSDHLNMKRLVEGLLQRLHSSCWRRKKHCSFFIFWKRTEIGFAGVWSQMAVTTLLCSCVYPRPFIWSPTWLVKPSERSKEKRRAPGELTDRNAGGFSRLGVT